MREVAELVGTQEWLDPVAKTLDDAVSGAFQGEAGRTLKDGLNGTWLGHPLHPVLTDIPIGAWMMAQIFDTLDSVDGGSRFEDAARVCINTGLVGAAGAAVTGLTEWSDTGGQSRRIGLVHGLLNITATSLFLTSAIMRTRRRTAGAVAASTAGFAVSMASAYLGGVLVYKREIGPNHAIAGDPPEEFTRTIADVELRDGDKRRVQVGDAQVVLLRQQGQLYALAERCAHQGGPLSEGELRDGTITCPWHGSRFRVADGSLVHGPSTFDQPCYETRVRDGFIEVRPRSA
jgi:nitrite reductase/ring-hydroxylating ferredoxin subunit/uncharacterized membrane protein